MLVTGIVFRIVRASNVIDRLNCENLCQDFQEDIEFKFSLGLVSMVKNFMGRASSKLLNTNHVETVSWLAYHWRSF